jgi:hypothetical protein
MIHAYKLLIAVLFMPLFTIGQSSDSISSVDIRYSKGQFDFQLYGMKSTEEVITFKEDGDSFVVSKFCVVQKLIDKQKIVHTDTVFYRIPDKKVSRGYIKKLAINLNEDKNNANENSVEKFIGVITDQQILDVVNQFKLNWLFDSEYSNKSDRKILIKNIKSHKFFREFFERIKPDYNIDTALIWANEVIGFTIVTYSLRDTIQYLGQLSNLVVQPFCKVLDSSSKAVKCFINLDVNVILSNLLPVNSIFKKHLDTELRKYYIKWALTYWDMWDK